MLLASGSAGAQSLAEPDQGFDAHGFNLAAHDADLRDPLVTHRPGAFSQGDFFFGGLMEFAKSPLVFEDPAVSESSEQPRLLDNVLALNLSGGLAAHDYVRFDLVAPVYFVSSGLDETDFTASSTQGPTLGDMRLSGLVMVVRPETDTPAGGFGFGVIANLDVPTGAERRYLGEETVAGGAGVAATYEFDVGTVSADLQAQAAPSLDEFGYNLEGGPYLVANAAIGALATDEIGVTFEVNMKPPFNDVAEVSFPAEALVSGRYQETGSNAFFTAGFGAGITQGPGVATFRLLLGGGFGEQADPGVRVDPNDLCPTQEETFNNYQDEDGCPDTPPGLIVRAIFRGEPYDADAVISGPEGTSEHYLPANGFMIPATPGTDWSATATADGCLVGASSTTMAQVETIMTIELQARSDAQARVEVVGPDDLPLGSATVQWTSSNAACVPAGMLDVDDNGKIAHGISAGTHKITVTAPNHTVVKQDVTFVAGDDKTIKVKLDATRISITKQQIVILEKVLFDTASARIQPESFPLLNEVSRTIIDNPDLGRVEVAGHTDSQGGDDYNLQLSQSRSDSVRAYLMNQGVPESRLIARGYGETLPVDTNATPAGREKNRRVEFNLLDARGGGQ